jgi:hypothetical protein
VSQKENPEMLQAIAMIAFTFERPVLEKPNSQRSTHWYHTKNVMMISPIALSRCKNWSRPEQELPSQ